MDNISVQVVDSCNEKGGRIFRIRMDDLEYLAKVKFITSTYSRVPCYRVILTTLEGVKVTTVSHPKWPETRKHLLDKMIHLRVGMSPYVAGLDGSPKRRKRV